MHHFIDILASQRSTASKDEIKEEHAGLVKREKELDNQLQEVKGIFEV